MHPEVRLHLEHVKFRLKVQPPLSAEEIRRFEGEEEFQVKSSVTGITVLRYATFVYNCFLGGTINVVGSTRDSDPELAKFILESYLNRSGGTPIIDCLLSTGSLPGALYLGAFRKTCERRGFKVKFNSEVFPACFISRPGEKGTILFYKSGAFSVMGGGLTLEEQRQFVAQVLDD